MRNLVDVLRELSERIDSVGKDPHPEWVTVKVDLLEDAAKTILSLLSRQRVESELRKGGGGGGGERLG